MSIKIKMLFIVCLFSLNQICIAMDKPELHECCGVKYKKNKFGDILPEWQQIPRTEIIPALATFVDAMKDKVKHNAFFITVPHEEGSVLDAIKKAGFSLYHADNEKTEWIVKSGAGVPEPYTTVNGASVIVKKGDMVLMVEEKTRKGFIDFPGGTANFFELPRVTAARELKEETGLVVNGDNLKLLAVMNRIKANRFGANNSIYFYNVDYSTVSGDLIIDSKEIIRTLWVPMRDVIEQEFVSGLYVAPSHAALIRHMCESGTHSYHKTFLDYRHNARKVHKTAHECNASDTMEIDFISQ